MPLGLLRSRWIPPALLLSCSIRRKSWELWASFINTHILLCSSHAFHHKHTDTCTDKSSYSTHRRMKLGQTWAWCLVPKLHSHTGGDRNGEHTPLIAPDASVSLLEHGRWTGYDSSAVWLLHHRLYNRCQFLVKTTIHSHRVPHRANHYTHWTVGFLKTQITVTMPAPSATRNWWATCTFSQEWAVVTLRICIIILALSCWSDDVWWCRRMPTFVIYPLHRGDKRVYPEIWFLSREFTKVKGFTKIKC